MGLFEKLKQKKAEKECYEKQSAFFRRPENAWARGCWIHYNVPELDCWKGVDPTGWDATKILEKFRSIDVFKEIKSLAKPGDKKGEEYVRFYTKRKEEFEKNGPAYRLLWDTEDEYYGYGGVAATIKILEACLIADNDFWQDDENASQSETPFVDICAITGWDYWNILLVSLTDDPERTCLGETGYIEFARAVLKYYKLYGNEPGFLWRHTMDRLAYCIGDGDEVPNEYGSIIAGRFGYRIYNNFFRSPDNSEIKEATPYSYVKDVSTRVAKRKGSKFSHSMFCEIKRRIFDNPKYWTSNDDYRKEMFNFIDEQNNQCMKVHVSYGKNDDDHNDVRGLTEVEIPQ